MRFGQVNSDHYTFVSLPKTQLFADLKSTKFELFVGSTNWTEPYWKGLIYPKNAKPNEYLKYYSNFFNTIELNTTYYRIPSIDQTKKWHLLASDNFTFCPKIPSLISQNKSIGLESEHWNSFNEAIEFFKNKLGVCFLQFSEYFDSSKYNALENLIYSNKIKFPTLFELRHASWFDNKNLLNQFCALISLHKLGLVITDTPGRQDVLHMNICCPYLLIRFVSNGDPKDDQMRVQNWISKINELKSGGLQSLYFIFHHPNPIQLVQFANMLRNNTNNQKI